MLIKHFQNCDECFGGFSFHLLALPPVYTGSSGMEKKKKKNQHYSSLLFHDLFSTIKCRICYLSSHSHFSVLKGILQAIFFYSFQRSDGNILLHSLHLDQGHQFKSTTKSIICPALTDEPKKKKKKEENKPWHLFLLEKKEIGGSGNYSRVFLQLQIINKLVSYI